MKRGLIALLLFSILLLPVVSASPDIGITGSYTPSPVKIGGGFKVLANVENIGSSVAESISCNLDAKYGFTISGSKTRTVMQLNPGSISTFEYSIEVSNDASSGTHTLTLECIEKGGLITKGDINVEVESKYGTLNIKDVRTEPEVIAPGEKAVLYLTLENNADYLMNSINMKLNLSTTDIAPFGEAAEKKIRSVSARSSQQVSFNIVALPGIKGGIYKIPIEMTYNDITTKSYSVSSYISIEIGSAPIIDASVDSSTIYGSKTIGEISLKLVNRGLTDLKFLNVKMDESEDYTVLSNDNVYIGDLDSDSYEIAEFRVKTGKFGKELDIPITIEFRDSSNKLYEQKKIVKFNKLSSSDAGSGGISIWTILIVLAIAGFFYYKYRKRKKKGA